MSTEIVRLTKSQELQKNAFGIVDTLELSNQDKAMRLIGLIPMALEVVDEARDTIERLNEEIRMLHIENTNLREIAHGQTNHY